MNKTNEYILKKFNIDPNKKSPTDISMKRREGLIELFKELDFKVGAEIGVLKGRYTKYLCEAGFKMYGIDPWKYYKTYNDYRSQWKLDVYEQEARERLKDFDCTLIKKWSIDAVKDFEDESLDFVYIDCNHALEYVIEDISIWSKKVKKGGIISGHDFFRAKHSNNLMHVKDAVGTWAYCYKIKYWFALRGDKCSSWMFVKE